MAAPRSIGTDLVCGNFEQTRFCAASILSFSSNVGWGAESSSVTAELVEDKCNTKKKFYFGGLNTVGGRANRDLLWGKVAQYTTGKDRFTKPAPGTPAHFQFAEFGFQGIVRDWEYKFGTSGDTISISLSSPTQLLNDSIVILDGYNGVSAVDLKGMPNLLPFFGWAENFYGVACDSPAHTATAFNEFTAGAGGIYYAPTTKIFGAIKNTDGVLWEQVRQYLLQLDPAVCFGDYCYKVDFSRLPGSPGYKLPGTHMSLLQIVETVCQDHGFDFYCYLDDSGATIGVDVIDRKVLPITGVIEGYVAGNPHVVSSSYGQEIRDELCNSFLVGDNVKVIWQMGLNCNKDNASDENCGIWPYWGHIDGNAIIGEGTNNDHTFFVDARTWGINGLDFYIIDVGEIRAALSGRDNWEGYVNAIANSQPGAQQNWPNLKLQSVGQKQNLVKNFNINGNGNMPDFKQLLQLIQAGKPVDQKLLQNWANFFINRRNQNQNNPNNPQKTPADVIYENVQKMGNEYFGKKYMVKVPWQCYDTRGVVGRDDFRMDVNWELAEGGWTEAYDIIGLNRIADPLGFEKFRSEEGLLTCFTTFQPLNKHQMKGFTTENSWLNPKVNPNRAFVAASPVTDEGDRGFVFKNSTLRTEPRAIISLGFNPILTKEAIGEDQIPAGSNLMREFLRLLTMPDADIKATLARLAKLFTNAPVTMSDIPGLPSAVALPMRSTRITYGPWTNTNGFELGKTEFIKDSEIAPWNFGSVATMNLAARLKVDFRQSKQLLAERGNIQIAGAPIVNLAGFLGGPSGPYITGIDVSVGSSGVTTTFNLQTFTPKFGNLSNAVVNNLQRSSQANAQSRKLILANAVAAKKQAIKNQGGNGGGGGGQGGGGGGGGGDDSSPGGGKVGGDNIGRRKHPDTDDKLYPIEYIGGDTFLRQSTELICDINNLTVSPAEKGFVGKEAAFLNRHQYASRLQVDDSEFYLNKWGVEIEGLWRGFSTVEHDLLPYYTIPETDVYDCKEAGEDGLSPKCGEQSASSSSSSGDDDKNCGGEEQRPIKWYPKQPIPPIINQDETLKNIPIILQTLDPYMMGTNSEGKIDGFDEMPQIHEGPSVQTDINYMVRGNGNSKEDRSIDIEIDRFQEGDTIRAAALRGPLLLAGWGYDLQGKPVPNEQPDDPNNRFEEHWLHKTNNWKVGPIDLRWDEERGVWCSPQPFKLVRVKLCKWVNPSSYTKGQLVDDDAARNGTGSKYGGSKEDPDCPGENVCVYNCTDRHLRKGWIVTAWYDTTTCQYFVIEAYKPIYKVKNEKCSLKPEKGEIVDAGPAPIGDQTTEVKFDNALSQPLWEGQTVYTTATCVDDEGVETHRILQGEFKGYDVVTWVNCVPTEEENIPPGSAGDDCIPEDDNCYGWTSWVLDVDGEWVKCPTDQTSCYGECGGTCEAPNPDDGRARFFEYDPSFDQDLDELERIQESDCWNHSGKLVNTLTDGERQIDEGYIDYVKRTQCICNSRDTCTDDNTDTNRDGDDGDDCNDYTLCVHVRKIWVQTPGGKVTRLKDGSESSSEGEFSTAPLGESCEPTPASEELECSSQGSEDQSQSPGETGWEG